MKQYVFNNQVYNCELLTENMESKKLYYFLRNTQNPSDVIKVAYDEMPEEYVPRIELFKAGDIVRVNGSYIDHIQCDMGFDVNLRPTENILDANGDKITADNEYVSVEGKFFKVGKYDILWQYNRNPGTLDGAKLIAPGSVSFISGKTMTNPIRFEYRNMEIFVDESECVQSTLSGEHIPEAWEDHYIEDGDEIITRNDIRENLTDEYEICENCDEISRV